MLSSQSVDYELIEVSKENIQPLKSGRNAQKLLESLSYQEKPHTEEMNQKLKDQRNQYEIAISSYQGNDPITPWLNYIVWTQQQYAAHGGVKSYLLPLLEKCTRTFLKTEQYKNNIRYLKIWLMYADIVNEPEDIYNFLSVNNIGQSYSVFYESWSLLLQHKNKNELAVKVLENGIAKLAQPITNLKNKLQQLRVKIAQQLEESLRNAPLQSLATNSILADPRNYARDALGRVISTQTIVNNENENVRQPLRGIASTTDTTIVTNPNTGLPMNITRTTAQRSIPLPQSQQQSSSSQSTGFRTNNPNINSLSTTSSSLGNFSVFVDESDDMEQNQTGLSLGNPNVTWDHLPSQDQRELSKENTVMISTWNAPLNQNQNTITTSTTQNNILDASNPATVSALVEQRTREREISRLHPSQISNAVAPIVAQSDIEVFVDEECNEIEDEKQQEAKQDSASMRRKLEGKNGLSEASNKLSKLTIDPLRNMKTQTTTTATPAITTTVTTQQTNQTTINNNNNPIRSFAQQSNNHINPSNPHTNTNVLSSSTLSTSSTVPTQSRSSSLASSVTSRLLARRKN